MIKAELSAQIHAVGNTGKECIRTAVDDMTRELAGHDSSTNTISRLDDGDASVGFVHKQRVCRGQSGDAGADDNRVRAGCWHVRSRHQQWP